MSSTTSSPQLNNKRKFSQTTEEENSPKQTSPTTTSSQQPPMVALPPPLMQYPNGQLISVIHPQQPYYQMYHPQQQQFYYPVSPQQHPFLTQQSPPTLTGDNTAPNNQRKASNTPRILPKNPDSPLSSPAGALYPQPPPSPFYHPYALQMSPTLIPNYPSTASRHNSISSSPGLGPTNTTADQREKARKVSHSAIERRRRERINDKILQLKGLIPSCAEQDNLHKMSILQSAIDYIAYLKDIVKSLDEHGTETTTEQLLKGDHLRVKMVKSMLPKEVEPFTTQFSVHKITPPEEKKKTCTTKDVDLNRGLKPMDVIKSGTPIVSTPLTPPQELLVKSTTTDQHNKPTTSSSSSTSSSPVLVSSLPNTPLLKPDETKHMSLQNILC